MKKYKKLLNKIIVCNDLISNDKDVRLLCDTQGAITRIYFINGYNKYFSLINKFFNFNAYEIYNKESLFRCINLLQGYNILCNPATFKIIKEYFKL
jgi:hypothetical protein